VPSMCRMQLGPATDPSPQTGEAPAGRGDVQASREHTVTSSVVRFEDPHPVRATTAAMTPNCKTPRR